MVRRVHLAGLLVLDADTNRLVILPIVVARSNIISHCISKAEAEAAAADVFHLVLYCIPEATD